MCRKTLFGNMKVRPNISVTGVSFNTANGVLQVSFAHVASSPNTTAIDVVFTCSNDSAIPLTVALINNSISVSVQSLGCQATVYVQVSVCGELSERTQVTSPGGGSSGGSSNTVAIVVGVVVGVLGLVALVAIGFFFYRRYKRQATLQGEGVYPLMHSSTDYSRM